MAESVNPFDKSTPAYFYYASLPDDKKSNLDYQIKRYGYVSTFKNLANTDDYIEFEKNVYEPSLSDPTNPFKFGTDTHKFFEALTPFGKQEMLKNPYALSTAHMPLTYGFGLEGALKNPQEIIYMTPSGLDRTGYAAYDERHKSIGPATGASLKDFLLSAASIALMVPGIGAGIGATIGATIAPTVTAATQAIIGNAIVQGTLAEAKGGEFLKGALTSVATAGVNTYANDLGTAIGVTDSAAATIVGKTLLQGALTEATGGDFIDGAVAGALSGAGQKVGETIGLEGSAASLVGTSITNGVIASVQGKDVSDAMINGAISGYLGYKEPKQVIEEVEAEQLAGPTDEEPFVPSVDQQTLNEVKESIQDEEVVSAEQTVQTQEEMQLSNDELLAELAPYEVPEIQEMVITAPREQTVLTQEEMQPSIDELTTELAPYEQPYIPTIDEETAQEEVVKEDEELTQLAGPTDEEPIDATEKEGSLAKETEITPAPVDYKKLLSLAGNLITGAGIYTGVKSLASRPPTTVTPPSSTTVTTPAVADEDIYKDAPIKGFSMRPDASGRYIPYIGEKAQLAKGGFISKKTKKSGLASRR